jgi:arabinofuranan 3-O-arabinosyltransferase
MSGTATLEFTPDRTYRRALLAGACLVLGLLLLVLLPARRRYAAEEVEPGRPRGLLRGLVVVAVGLLALGVAGAAVAVVAFLLARRGVPRRWFVAAGVVLATAVAVVAPWPSGTTWDVGWRTLAAVLVSVGTGAVVGGLMAPVVRTGAPTAAPVVPPTGT